MDIRFGSPPCCKKQLCWDSAHSLHVSINCEGEEEPKENGNDIYAQERRYTVNNWMSHYWPSAVMRFYTLEPRMTLTGVKEKIIRLRANSKNRLSTHVLGFSI